MKSRTRITASPAGALCSFLVSLLYAPLLHAAQDWQFALLASGVILHFSLLYLLASRWRYTAAGEFVKGAYIGLNAAWNMMLLHLLTGSWSLGSIAAVIVLLSSFLHISRHSAYHTLLGWTNWLLPMSWPVNLPGLLGLIANLCLAPLSHKRGWGHWRMRLFFHGPSCTLTMFGGRVRPFKGFTGLNMGNFIYIKPGSEHLLAHEIGHLFSVGALGFTFHYIGGIDEAYLQENRKEALAEHFAESYSTPAESVLSMWK